MTTSSGCVPLNATRYSHRRQLNYPPPCVAQAHSAKVKIFAKDRLARINHNAARFWAIGIGAFLRASAMLHAVGLLLTPPSSSRQPHPSSLGCTSSTGSAFDDRAPCARSRARRRRPIARSRSASSQRPTLPRATSLSRTLATSACPCPRSVTSTSTRASSVLPGELRPAGKEGTRAQQTFADTYFLQTHLVAHGSLDSDREGAGREVSVSRFTWLLAEMQTGSDRSIANRGLSGKTVNQN